MKKVSVIVPTHNSNKYINECISSLINQTYKNLEIIVVDDGSTDDTLEIIKTKKDKRIKIINTKKHIFTGIARNIGIDESNGDYICFLDSDDIFLPDKIEKQLKYMEDNKLNFTYTNFIYLNENNKKHYAKLPKKLDYNHSLKNTSILTSTVMLNMNFFKKEDIYMPNLEKGQDTATWWRILKKGLIAYNYPEFLTLYRVHKKSLSSNKISAIKRTWNLYKLEDISYPKKIFCFICYAFNAVRRRIL